MDKRGLIEEMQKDLEEIEVAVDEAKTYLPGDTDYSQAYADIAKFKKWIECIKQLPDSEREECELIKDTPRAMCSKCGYTNHEFPLFDFCPNCGARIKR